MTFKKISGKLHLWLGLTAGLVVFISLLAAAVFVWEQELNEWYHHDKIFVKSIGRERLPMDTIIAKARTLAFADSTLTFMNVDSDPAKAFSFMNYKPAVKKGWTWASGMDAYSRIYVDQYTGEVLGAIDMRYDWIFSIRMLHQCLLINYDVGHYIVGFATLIILIMVVTGIVLWWPKNKAALKQRVWFRWKDTTRWKRKNYDLHNIGGIYSFFFIIIFALTGLVWTFDWWEDSVYRMLGNDPQKVFPKPPVPAPAENGVSNVLDLVLADAAKRVPGWENMGISILRKEDRAISMNVKYTSGRSGWNEWDNYYYHPKTGELYHTITHDQKTLGAKWRNSNYPIHVGSIYGWPTKLLATFIALFCASLPVTGFYIWWGRRKKAKTAVSPPVKKTPMGKSIKSAEALSKV